MANTYTDATGVLHFADGKGPTPIIRALFGPFELDEKNGDAGDNGAYIASIAESSNTSWETITGNLAEAAEEMGLINEDEEDSTDLTLSEIVERIATHLGVDPAQVTGLDEVDSEQDADIDAVFDLALLLDDGHGLESISWEGAHHSDRQLISGFGGFGFYGSRHVALWNNSQRPLTMGEALDAAIGTNDDTKAAEVLHAEVERLLDSIIDPARRQSIQQALLAKLVDGGITLPSETLWVNHGPLSIGVRGTHEGVMVDVYGRNAEMSDSLAEVAVLHADGEAAVAEDAGIDLDEVAEWVGLHYGKNFDAESPQARFDWIQRYIESHRQAVDA
jgi:hypothetical protein